MKRIILGAVVLALCLGGAAWAQDPGSPVFPNVGAAAIPPQLLNAGNGEVVNVNALALNNDWHAGYLVIVENPAPAGGGNTNPANWSEVVVFHEKVKPTTNEAVHYATLVSDADSLSGITDAYLTAAIGYPLTAANVNAGNVRYITEVGAGNNNNYVAADNSLPAGQRNVIWTILSESTVPGVSPALMGALVLLLAIAGLYFVTRRRASGPMQA